MEQLLKTIGAMSLLKVRSLGRSKVSCTCTLFNRLSRGWLFSESDAICLEPFCLACMPQILWVLNLLCLPRALLPKTTTVNANTRVTSANSTLDFLIVFSPYGAAAQRCRHYFESGVKLGTKWITPLCEKGFAQEVIK